MRENLRDIHLEMYLAYKLAEQSPDTSTKNGAIVYTKRGQCAGSGVNTFPKGVEILPERLERPTKYAFTEHAERNAIFSAGRSGVSLVDGTMVAAWASCADCARAIVCAGIKTLVRNGVYLRSNDDKWKDSIALGDIIMREGGVEIVDLEFRIPKGLPPFKNLHNGELIEPWIM